MNTEDGAKEKRNTDGRKDRSRKNSEMKERNVRQNKKEPIDSNKE